MLCTKTFTFDLAAEMDTIGNIIQLQAKQCSIDYSLPSAYLSYQLIAKILDIAKMLDIAKILNIAKMLDVATMLNVAKMLDVAKMLNIHS